MNGCEKEELIEFCQQAVGKLTWRSNIMLLDA